MPPPSSCSTHRPEVLPPSSPPSRAHRPSVRSLSYYVGSVCLHRVGLLRCRLPLLTPHASPASASPKSSTIDVVCIAYLHWRLLYHRPLSLSLLLRFFEPSPHQNEYNMAFNPSANEAMVFLLGDKICLKLICLKRLESELGLNVICLKNA
ncbi:hypothetical protein L2E82_05171 [Cichorium intybus]|uniref:Uncharacterized protein n=1 Tax=Cichorium intybus TaxID=13427 RepID=A0ACB9H7V1_CICIN|nr:hypothetical protein L2E82_05171 [Cichorium intybus]